MPAKKKSSIPSVISTQELLSELNNILKKYPQQSGDEFEEGLRQGVLMCINAAKQCKDATPKPDPLSIPSTAIKNGYASRLCPACKNEVAKEAHDYRFSVPKACPHCGKRLYPESW